MPIDSRGDWRSQDQWRRWRVAPIALALLLLFPLPGVSRAGTFAFPVQSEQIVTGTTSGPSAAQTADGVVETLREANTAPDVNTPASAETIATGSRVSGAFPSDIQVADNVFVQYRESTDSTEAAIAYRSNTGADLVMSPKTRTWDGSAWAAESEQPTAGSSIRAVREAFSPVTSGLRIIVTQSDDGWLDAYVCAPACTVTNNIGQVWSTAPGTPQSRFGIAYESLSGDALLVYGVLSTDTTRDIAYKTYVGGTWSAEQYLDDAGHATDAQYSLIKLASKKGSDQIGLVGADDTNDHVNAWIWDGSAFGSSTEITASAENPDRDQVAIAWESSSGDLLAVAAVRGSSDIISREFTTSWSGASQFQCANAAPIHSLSLKANPVSTANDMILAVGDDDPGLSTCRWTGTGWATRNSHDTSIDSLSTRPFDFAWEDSGSKGLLVWGTNSGQMTYRAFTAPNTWGPITNVAMGANRHAWVQLRTNPFRPAGATKILGAVMENSANDLGGLRWDGTTFTVMGASTFSTDVGTTSWESFDLEYHATNDDRLLVRYDWTGVPAGISYTLQLKGYRGDENVDVRVLTPPATWTPRLTISATANALYTYRLTPAEYNGGSPAIRFVDANGSGGAQSDLWLDWAAITSVRQKYSLDVRQNVTGIFAGSGPVLVVRGNITSGGENFHVHAWNFTTTAWDLLLAAPFTATNAYHNASLAAGYLSGGTVRVRYVDAASADATQWSLSLDYVAVVITNAPASLAGGGVAPAIGNISTTFAFFVRYADSENESPAFVNLNLDGVPFPMSENKTADFNYADGKDYFLNRLIGVRGVHTFSFSARSATGDMALASTGAQQVTVVNRPPGITNPVSIDGVQTGRPYVRELNASDPDGDALTWSLATNASWLSLNPTSGTLTGTAVAGVYYVNVTVQDPYGGVAYQNVTIVVLPPPWWQSQAFPGSLSVLLFGVAAFLAVFFLVVRTRRRPIVEQAFFLDSAGEVRFEFSGPNAPFDEAQLESLLARGSWTDIAKIEAPPYFLHLVPHDAGHWVLVSREPDADRVRKAAHGVIVRAGADLSSVPPEEERGTAEA